MTKEMEKKVASISTHLQSYKESVENLPMEQSVKSREDQELYKVLAKEADELKIVISKREKARKKASVEKERQEISKEKVYQIFFSLRACFSNAGQCIKLSQATLKHCITWA